MKKKERVAELLKRLDGTYGTSLTAHLVYENAFQLLIATILSAQCTDARVNQVTPALFARFPDPQAFAKAGQKEVEKLIHATGFYRNKAGNIIACAKKLVSDYGGEVPEKLEDLTSLPGVGRKTANVVRGNIFGTPSVVVDTHVGRISRRLGLTKETDPAKVEQDLMRVLPRDNWIRYNIQIIILGREICKARRPKCGECFLSDLCPSRETSV